MGLRDFINEHYASKQQSVAQASQAPESAKQMYSREAAQETSSRKPVEQLPDSVKREAVEAARPAAQAIDKANDHREQGHSAPSEKTDGKEALIRNQGDQGKTQKALSPTDHGKSQTKNQERSRGRGMER